MEFPGVLKKKIVEFLQGLIKNNMEFSRVIKEKSLGCGGSWF